jgi:hypothetical protein
LNALHDTEINKLVQLIESGIDINLRINKYGRSLLHYTVMMGDQEKTSFLLSRNANVSVIDEHGDSPIFFSVSKPSTFYPLVIMQSLISAGARINQQNNKGETVLHRACVLCNMEAIEILLKAGVDVHLKDKKGRVPLQHVGQVCNCTSVSDSVICSQVE